MEGPNPQRERYGPGMSPCLVCCAKFYDWRLGVKSGQQHILSHLGWDWQSHWLLCSTMRIVTLLSFKGWDRNSESGKANHPVPSFFKSQTCIIQFIHVQPPKYARVIVIQSSIDPWTPSPRPALQPHVFPLCWHLQPLAHSLLGSPWPWIL